MLFTKENTRFRFSDPPKWVNNTPAQPMIGLLKALSVAFTVLFAFNCGVWAQKGRTFVAFTPSPHPQSSRKIVLKYYTV
jgi:hypothetical protein